MNDIATLKKMRVAKMMTPFGTKYEVIPAYEYEKIEALTENKFQCFVRWISDEFEDDSDE